MPRRRSKVSKQQSEPVGPREDDELKHETSGLEQGTPPGMDPDDVEQRSEIARFLDRGAFPGRREDLVEAARRNQAPDAVVSQLERLPQDQEFSNVQDVARAAGLGTEEQRT
jgi:hypothetical protein